jgi:NAD(P)H-dependent FMN reductase
MRRDWVAGLGRVRPGLAIEVLDLADWPLPLDDEPGIPALGHYATERTRAWSARIASADGFAFVAPQYNWGYPAALKNAIDHLYREWRGKPAMIVSYGGHGGGKCAAQLRQVADGLKMRLAATMPGLELSDDMMRDASVSPARDFARHVEAVEQAWGELEALLATKLQAPTA